MKKSCFFLFIVLTFCSQGQQDIDSLKKLLKTEKNSLAKSALLNQLADRFFYEGWPDSGLASARRSLQILDHISLKEEDKIQVLIQKSKSYGNIADALSRTGDEEGALLNALKAAELAEESGDIEQISCCYNNIGHHYLTMRNFDKAAAYLKKALEIAEKTDNKSDIAFFSGNLATVYSSLEDQDKASLYYDKAIKNLEAVGDKKTMISTFMSYSLVYENGSKPDVARSIEYQLKALKLMEETGIKRQIISSYLGLGRNYRKLSDHKNSLRYFDLACHAAKQHQNPDMEMLAQDELSTLYGELGKYKEAYESLSRYEYLHDSIKSVSVRLLVDELTRHENANKAYKKAVERIQKNLFENEYEHKRALNILFLISGILLFALLMFRVYTVKSRKR